jgi:hypothetical protein
MMHDGTWDARQWERIEEEYHEPAREVVRVMHWDMRVPLRHVATALYVNEGTLRKWCRMWDLPTRKRGYVKTHVPGKVQLRARLLGYRSVSQAVGSMRAEGLRWEDIQMRLGCSSSTVSRYLPEDAKGYYNLTDEGRAIKAENARRLNESGMNGRMPNLRLVQPLR